MKKEVYVKAGDWVKCINPTYGYAGLICGEIYYVESVQEDNFKLSEGGSHWLNPLNLNVFELYEEKRKFKVGDKIKCIKEGNAPAIYNHIYTVKQVHLNHFVIDGIDDIIWGNSLINELNVFELYEEKREFQDGEKINKIGDYSCVNWKEYVDSYIGRPVIIKGKGGSIENYRIGDFNFHKDSLELVEEDKTSSISTILIKKRKFKRLQ